MEIKEYVAYRKEELRKEIANMDCPPKLVIIKANDSPASASYVKGKLKDAEEVGINAELIELDPSISQEELDKKIEEINGDSSVDGFIVQLPLPKHI
ncbi:MAG: bifunctional methylenetetrahydrofolate dehydrogenase/methenyltetrahydrofolate cyclohydrolase, partial [Bacilli bacterium]|nr:bifunctional methylenetetrahydrofolate dehydrogenase/methenyltetrahydrofolate cyclohydrolase [Bacilli bacterium]